MAAKCVIEGEVGVRAIERGVWQGVGGCTDVMHAPHRRYSLGIFTSLCPAIAAIYSHGNCLCDVQAVE